MNELNNLVLYLWHQSVTAIKEDFVVSTIINSVWKLFSFFKFYLAYVLNVFIVSFLLQWNCSFQNVFGKFLFYEGFSSGSKKRLDHWDHNLIELS